MPLLQLPLCCCCTACLPRMSHGGLLVLVCDNPLPLLLRHPVQGPKGELQRTFHHLVKLEKVRRGCHGGLLQLPAHVFCWPMGC